MLIRVGSRGSRLALTQAELAAVAPARAGHRDRARPDHDRRRPRPVEAVRRDRLARRLRQGARGGAARAPHRRRRALGEGHDVDRSRRPRRRRVSRARRSARRALRRRRDSARACGSARRRRAARRSCSRSSRRSRSSRCAATSTRVCASAASAGSTRSCSPRAGSTGSASRTRSAIASTPSELLPEAAQGALALQVRAGEEHLVAAADHAETRRRVEAERAAVAAVGGGCLAPVAAHHDGTTLTALDRRRGRLVARAPHRRRPGRARPRARGARSGEDRRHPRGGAGRSARRAARGARPRGRALPADPDRAARRRADRPVAATTGSSSRARTARAELARRLVGAAGAARGDRPGHRRRAARARAARRPRPARVDAGGAARRAAARAACCSPRPRARAGCSSTSAAPTSCRSTARSSCGRRAPDGDVALLASRVGRAGVRRDRRAACPWSRSGRRRRPRRARSASRSRPSRSHTTSKGCSTPYVPSMMFITFLTDFGLEDDFVGTCHGVIKRIAPEAQIIDITHGDPARPDPAGRARRSRTRCRTCRRACISRSSIPASAAARRPLALRDAEGRLYVGPDNGLLLPAADRFGGVVEAHELANPAYALDSVSRTFHGRDLFSPAAAHLALGVPLGELGPPIDPDALVRLELPEPEVGAVADPGDRARRRPLREHRAQPDAASTSTRRRSCPACGSSSRARGNRYYAVAARTFADATAGRADPLRGQLPQRRGRRRPRQRRLAPRRRGGQRDC